MVKPKANDNLDAEKSNDAIEKCTDKSQASRDDEDGDKKPAARADTNNESDDDDESEEEEEVIACCLCHCSVDYADKEAFFGPSRRHGGAAGSSSTSSSNAGSIRGGNANSRSNSNDEDDTASGGKNDPLLLPAELYDAHNNIVFCDGCDRPYHQKCHFVPLISLPRGDWHCLICRYQKDFTSNHNKKKKRSSGGSSSGKQKQHPKQHRSLTRAQLKKIYSSPPCLEEDITVHEWQHTFEFETSQLKAQLWKKELTVRLTSAFQQQLAQIRHAENTLRAYTSTHRARQFLSNRSQELSQTLCKLASAKWRIRTLFLSLHKLLLGPQWDWNVLQTWLETQEPCEQKKWFPFGRNLERRIVPRFEEERAILAAAASHRFELVQQHSPSSGGGVPCEVVLKPAAAAAAPTKTSVGMTTRHAAAAAGSSQKKKDDDSEMISLDDLQCCVCFKGDATDENDVLLCDGQGCFRAHHMNCVSPHVSMEEAQDEDKDWFCPLCHAIGKFLFDVQSEYMGHEWEEKHYWKHHGKPNDNDSDDDDDDNKSWAQPSDVFPEAEKELEVATKWKKGFRDQETDAMISSVFGINPNEEAASNDVDDDSNDDDQEDDDDFDLEAFQTEKRDVKDDSTVSSDATLLDMSSVEYEIDRTELDALSHGGGSSDEENEQALSSSQHRRRTRASSRARGAAAFTDNDDANGSEPSSKPDIGTLDESNIVRGKRNRTKVDYRKLNDAMFGMIDDEEAVKLFDDRDDEFRVTNGSATSASTKGKRGRRRQTNATFSEAEQDESVESDKPAKKKKKPGRVRKRAMKAKERSTSSGTRARRNRSRKSPVEEEEDGKPKKKDSRTRTPKRAAKTNVESESDEESEHVRKKQTRKSKSKRATTDAKQGKTSKAGKPTKKKRRKPTNEEPDLVESEPKKATRGRSPKSAAKSKKESIKPVARKPKGVRRPPRKPYESSLVQESLVHTASKPGSSRPKRNTRPPQKPYETSSDEEEVWPSSKPGPSSSRKPSLVSPSGKDDAALSRKRKKDYKVKSTSDDEKSENRKIPAKGSPQRKRAKKSTMADTRNQDTGRIKQALQNGYNDHPPKRRSATRISRKRAPTKS